MTKFQKFFSAVTEQGLLKIRGATLVAEVLDDEELKSKGGLILSAPKEHARGGVEENRLKVARIVAVGEGYLGENGESIPCDTKVGAIVILPKYSAQTVSIFPGLADMTNDKLVLLKEESILAMYETEENYNKARAVNVEEA